MYTDSDIVKIYVLSHIINYNMPVNRYYTEDTKRFITSLINVTTCSILLFKLL